MLPGMDGFTLHEALHHDARTRSVPVIIVTAKDWTRPAFTPSVNVVAFLAKPFDISLLREAVSVALGPS
jgi:CheY-like chemotaxis protein